MLKNQKTLSLMITAILIFTMTFPLILKPTYAAIPMLDQIRVALFIDTRSTVPSVTLSSADGLHIGIRNPSGVKEWLKHESSSSVRGSADQYMLHLIETNDYNTAHELADRVNGFVGEAYVMSHMKEGKPFYRVYIGQFTTEGQAKVAREHLAARYTLQGTNVGITGPFHWNAGTYATEAEALERLNIIYASGLHANLVYHENSNGELVYSVWIGEAANAADLDLVQAKAKEMMPGLTLQPVNPELEYLLKRKQSQSGKEVPHFFFNSGGQKVWISSEKANIQIAEKNRSYRGTIELSSYANRLAVINELPFEQYLYSVVSSELGASWPLEALKAQAVAARTYALTLGMKYKIAHVSDTTYEQAYKGSSAEFPLAVTAVDATIGEILVDKKGIIEPFYYSNAGGMTADASEIWGTPLDYIKSVPSPDQLAEEGKLLWNRVVLPNGVTGYVRSDFTVDTGEKNSAGFPYLIAEGTGVNVRPAPYVDDTNNKSIAQINYGDRLILIDQTLESNAYSWIRGPFSADQLLDAMNRTGKSRFTGELETLEISKRGPSGRVVEMKANGQIIEVTTPDSYRTSMNGLLSTRFDVEETGRYTILGANDERHFPENNGPLYVLTGDSSTSSAKPITSDEMIVLNAKSEARLITKEAQFRFIGFGFGHGIGMSQWGARDLAEFVGYDYQQILKYYYNDVNIVKE